MEVFISTNPASPPMVNFIYLGMPAAGALFPFSDIVDITKAGAEKNMNVLCKNKTKRVTLKSGKEQTGDFYTCISMCVYWYMHITEVFMYAIYLKNYK